jgi:hypothetical protein
MEASYRLLKTFGTWPKDTWRCSSAFIACLQTIQPNPSTEAWDLALYSGHLQTHATTCYPHSSLHPQSEFHTSFLSLFVFLRSVHWLLVTANVVPSSPILVTLKMVALCSSKTSVLTRATWRNIPEDAILHSRIILHMCIMQIIHAYFYTHVLLKEIGTWELCIQAILFLTGW